ncbi:MAG: trigger factor [Nitrospinaceae bacterium]|jgi:trigger factor|nr:trigger factor [Nitrospinaceae bacterium]MBT4095552.1 trigger factor [Nitrospinaceae bacterium]MBT4429573.1 trigger factor [Nitrospinaceae bacterium]MBT5369071.1 trigger factor [Nitrospinaceae bacterium]MBT7855732.1 trigger factor [Nitrospinaceae bacterium]
MFSSTGFVSDLLTRDFHKKDMTSTITDIDACTKRLEVAIPRDEVVKEVNRTYSRLAGQVKIKGFRKGKVPRRILEQYYGEEVQAEVVNRVISSSCVELLEEKGMSPVGEPNVTDINNEDESSDLTYKAIVEVIPPYELGEYKGIEIEVPKTAVTEDMIQEQVDRFLMQAATYEDVERGAQEDDYVTFDIEGFDGETLVPDTKRENETLLLGGGRNEKELEDTILGMKAGEEQDFEVDVPESGPPNLAGKSLRFHVKLKGIKEPHPPELNDEYVKTLGGGLSTVDELREQVKKEIEAQADSMSRQQGTTLLLSKLVDMHKFDLPASLINSEADERIKEYEQQARQENPNLEITSGQREQMRESILPQAEERVRQMILIDRIREQENIDAGPEEIDAHIAGMAARYQMEPDQLRERMEEMGGMASLIKNINYNKAVDWLYEQAEVEITVAEAAPEGGAQEESNNPE